MHVYTHAPLPLAFTHMHRKPLTTAPLTHPQEVLQLSMSEREGEVEIGCRKAIIVVFASHLLVTQRFLLELRFTTFGSDLTHCYGLVWSEFTD